MLDCVCVCKTKRKQKKKKKRFVTEKFVSIDMYQEDIY